MIQACRETLMAGALPTFFMSIRIGNTAPFLSKMIPS
jgi:hypothetical protein